MLYAKTKTGLVIEPENQRERELLSSTQLFRLEGIEQGKEWDTELCDEPLKKWGPKRKTRKE